MKKFKLPQINPNPLAKNDGSIITEVTVGFPTWMKGRNLPGVRRLKIVEVNVDLGLGDSGFWCGDDSESECIENEVNFLYEVLGKNEAFPKKRKAEGDDEDSGPGNGIDLNASYRVEDIKGGVLSVKETFGGPRGGKGRYFDVFVEEESDSDDNDDDDDNGDGNGDGDVTKITSELQNSQEKSVHDKMVEKNLFLSPEDLAINGFPLYKSVSTASEVYIESKLVSEDLGDWYCYPNNVEIGVGSVSPRVFGIDCEMVRTKVGLELGRVTVVDEHSKVIYDKYVKPQNNVLDYLTEYSGLTPALLEAESVCSIKSIQDDIFGNIIHLGDIVCGHSLENDFKAMRVALPILPSWEQPPLIICDSSLLFKRRGGGRHGLAHLTSIVLGREIQKKSPPASSAVGHDSGEDAIAALELVMKMTEEDFTFEDIRFGDNNSIFGEQTFDLVDVVEAVHYSNSDGSRNMVARSKWGRKVTLVEEASMESGWLKSYGSSTADLSSTREAIFKKNNNNSLLVWGRIRVSENSEKKNSGKNMDGGFRKLIETIKATTPTDVLVVVLFQRGVKDVRGMIARKKAFMRSGGRGTLMWGKDDEEKLKVGVEKCRMGRGVISMGGSNCGGKNEQKTKK